VAATIDIFPTLAAITGAKLPAFELDGKTIIDLWKANSKAVTPHEFYFMVYNGQSVRSGDWKYHKKQIFTVNKENNKDQSPALYNLKEDIGETKNLVNDYPEIAQKLASALDAHLTRLNIKK
jgi:arylsulfatase A-like enzyme